jgi:molybdopterin-guanine dinucleotide biosynthesis protein A
MPFATELAARHKMRNMVRDDVTGFVLAGGKSSRMGRDKAVLSLDGCALLERALSTAGEVAHEVFILGPNRLSGNFGKTIEDIYPGCGPLGGIHAALSYLKREKRADSAEPRLALIIAVDTPFLTAEFLSFMIDRATQSGAVVTTPEIGGYTQPLCAVYSLEFLPIAEQALKVAAAGAGKSREYKIVPLFPEGKTLVIGEPELKGFAFMPEMFENLNKPEDVARIRRRSQGKSG